ncbi:hypothetical protein M2171_001271 [Bradyrhizobium japonicum USDA 38]|uniref:hypothetical protein n=1 Tax=Bradyrhizobium japonicum TaxID=375 RepID=UPI0003F95C21|nr:hypothetical protein [Bradyrhizobium japonicum]MCS3892138.1 hypothetical protein [Bradyrhizobium japonicum USDA 38]MCS3944652.1 hypothetical protein [Bradyrhizobium japonicum]
MKTILSAAAAFVLLATPALADEVPPPQKIQQAGDSAKEADDCSKQVWPHFSQACLRSEGKGIAVRLVTTERR